MLTPVLADALRPQEYVEQVPLESILAHNPESLAALKGIVERERARTLAALQVRAAAVAV